MAGRDVLLGEHSFPTLPPCTALYVQGGLLEAERIVSAASTIDAAVLTAKVGGLWGEGGGAPGRTATVTAGFVALCMSCCLTLGALVRRVACPQIARGKPFPPWSLACRWA